MSDPHLGLHAGVSNQQNLISAVLASLPRSLSEPQKTQLEEFIPAYFKPMPEDELASFSAEDLAGAAISHWQLAKSAIPETPHVLVFNPSFESHGWQSPHTIIQIVAQDQPWLVSSVQGAIDKAGLSIHHISHPILRVARNSEQHWEALDASAPGESFIHLEIDAQSEDDQVSIRLLLDNLFNSLALIRHDASDIHNIMSGIATSLKIREQGDFVSWLDQKQFAWMGYAQLIPADGFASLHNCLGILDAESLDTVWSASALLPDGYNAETLESVFDCDEVVVCKSEFNAPAIRNEPADLIIHAQRDAQGKIETLHCGVGLFIAGLQNEAVSNIPWMRNRLERVLEASGSTPESHDGKAMASIMRGLPRDMLMQTRSSELIKMASGIVSLQERAQVRLFYSSDALGRFCNCLVYIPRDSYSRDLRLNIEHLLNTHIDGISEGFDIRFSSDSNLARLHFVIQKNPPYLRSIDWPNISKRIRQVSVSWTDKLDAILKAQNDEISAIRYFKRYANAFPPGYREDYSARTAVADIDFIEKHVPDHAPVMSFYRHIMADSGVINFKLFAMSDPVSLSDVIPVIENMGLKVESEHPFEIRRQNAETVWIHEFTVQQTSEIVDDRIEETAVRIQTAFDQIWKGDVENDGFNRLILEAKLDWRQVVIIRALCKYLLQLDVPFSQAYMIDSLVANASITQQLVDLFEARFNPDQQISDEDMQDKLMSIDRSLDNIVSLDEDRILRGYKHLILAILRTNTYRLDDSGAARNFLSFKFDCAAVPDLPLPHPLYEIFVYSSQVEGIHLRGGSVARGGLRWSDRREDYRTEVLGLMKAQMVKNAVIVPVGSKGGFYVKAGLPKEREAMMEIVVDCYKTFLSGLLDITDNLDAATIVPPPRVVRYDNDDPYLVVAADKGTATFSDYANAVAMDYGYWLGDAFASGGSVGYDHKKMGITARGAWESVKRHFRNRGVDSQQESFTAVGIGDMAGDVFGNGMLLSPHLKLIAAFNHQHIFIDPNPDTASTFEERSRLFALPRSSWTDYNSELISEGGGIFERSAKQIELSPQAQAALGTDEKVLQPTDLISIILKAPVDLLWNGGIGTYVKASSETHVDAADRANDNLRINGKELRAKIVGEGGNLGFTQRGRIEFAQSGGLIYTDAIDNSAGVDCSDHEVNIKILANAFVASDDMTIKQRDALLESMTDDVAAHVLNDNYLQTQCVDICVVDSVASLNEQSRFMQHLESIGRLDRAIEFLPDNDEIIERTANDQALVGPELAVLVSYSKMVMFDDLMDSKFTEDTALEQTLIDYFPDALKNHHSEQITTHRLRREIVATVVTNEVVNRLGPTFAFRMQQELSATASDVAKAFVAVKEIFGLAELWSSIESLDNVVDSAEQYRMHILVRGLAERAMHWLIRTRKCDMGIADLISTFKPGLIAIKNAMPGCLSPLETETLDQRITHFTQAGSPEDVAQAIAGVVPLSSSLDIVEIAQSLDQPVDSVAALYFTLGQHLELSWLREHIGQLDATSHWHKLAASELRGDLHYQQRHLCAEVANSTDQNLSAVERVSLWSDRIGSATVQYQTLISDLKLNASVDFAMLSLAVNEVHKLLRFDRPLAS